MLFFDLKDVIGALINRKYYYRQNSTERKYVVMSYRAA